LGAVICLVEISKTYEFAMGEERHKINSVIDMFEENIRKLLTHFTLSFSSADYYNVNKEFDENCD